MINSHTPAPSSDILIGFKQILLIIFSHLSVLFSAGAVFAEQSDSAACQLGPGELTAAASGSFAEREKKFRSIIEKCPAMAEAHYNYGVMLLENNQPNLSIEHFEAAVRLRNVTEYKLGLASALFLSADNLTARDMYEKILSEDPREIRALLGIAAVLDKAGKYSEALDYLNKAFAIEPENTFVNYNIGIIYDRLEQYEASVVSFERVVRSDPKNSRAQYLLGVGLSKLDRQSEALNALKKAAEMSDSPADASRAYAWQLEENGLFDDAEVVLRRALAVHQGDRKIQEQLVLVLLRKNQEGNAKPIIDQLLQKTPSDARLLALHGWTAMRLGDFAAAEKSLKEAVSADPAAAFAFYALGQLYRQSGQHDLATTNLNTAYTIEPGLKENAPEWWKFW